MSEYRYQTRQFTCKKCGVTFEVYSDSAILSQQFCNECKLKKGDIV